MKRALLALAILSFATVANAELPLDRGFGGALRGCETWVLEPATWADGVAPFEAKVGLGSSMGLVDKISDESLPPEQLRLANHYWRINSSGDTGYLLVVSDRLPICHITGGGGIDLRPAIMSTLSSPDFKDHWKLVGTHSSGGLISNEYRNHEEPKFSMMISFPDDTHWSIDKLQVIATAQMQLGN